MARSVLLLREAHIFATKLETVRLTDGIVLEGLRLHEGREHVDDEGTLYDIDRVGYIKHLVVRVST
jgi:hypothetical protein